jgi:myo-inositol-1(or 4)-monophosphatase
MIAERFTGHAVLGEEFGSSSDRDAGPQYCWVFDPVDGTTNYAHGLPIFCSSLALEIEGRIAVGAIYDPTRRELFTAERGHGAWLNGRPLRVSTEDTLLDSLLVTGFHYGIQRDPEELVSLFREFIARARAVRRLGSAALDLCYVAAGRFEAFWEQKLNPWDISAGALLVQEAGGRVTDSAGRTFSSRTGSIVASNGRVHDAVVETIAGFLLRFRSRNWTD